MFSGNMSLLTLCLSLGIVGLSAVLSGVDATCTCAPASGCTQDESRGRCMIRQDLSHTSQVSYGYTTSCGLWGWRRCSRTGYRSVQRYSYQCNLNCCGGYSLSGTSCIPICNPSCGNGGTCTSPSVCSCTRDWTGSNCETPVCTSPCQNGGTCSSPGVCTCDTSQWTGSTCEEPVCTPECQNSGSCTSPGVCACAAGWTGSRCAEGITTSTSSSSSTTSSASSTSSSTSTSSNAAVISTTAGTTSTAEPVTPTTSTKDVSSTKDPLKPSARSSTVHGTSMASLLVATLTPTSTKISPPPESKSPSPTSDTSFPVADSLITGRLAGLAVGCFFLLALLTASFIVTVLVLRWRICARRHKKSNENGNIYADPNDVMLTGFGNTDGMATTIRDDNAVMYSVVDNGGNSDGVHIPNPMYATVKEQENMYTLYQYVPTKKLREVGCTKQPEAILPYSTIYGSIEESLQEGNKMSESNDSPYKEPSSVLGELYDDLASMQCLEIPQSHLKFGSTLGSGEFGVVCKGEWLTPQGPREVALKVSHEDVPDTEKVKLLQEAAIMKQFRHPNVVRLLGTVTVSEPLILVVEILKNGSLLSYISKLPKEMNESRKKQFLKFSFQIAQGMRYLSNKGFVHRDLATRNVLLDQDFVCKISDFGLSRNLDESTYYVTTGGKVPLRWTAPEALFYRKYSSSSDVWSYGMTLFEIWSFGERPFSTLSSEEIIACLNSKLNGSNHEVLSSPRECPSEVYDLMLQCWNVDHRTRLTFADILTALGTQ